MKKNPMIRFKDMKRVKKISSLTKILFATIAIALSIGFYNTNFSNVKTSDAITAGFTVALLPVFVIKNAKGEDEFKELKGTDWIAFKAEATEDQLEEYFTTKHDHYRSKLEDLVKNNASKEDVQEMMNALKNNKPNDYDTLKEEHIQLMADFKAFKEVANTQAYKDDLRSQIKTWVKDNEPALKAISSGNKADLKELTIKVASPMTPANTYNGSAYLPQPEFESGINDIVRVEPTFWDYIKKGRTGSAAYVWVNKKNPLGAAAFIAPGVFKPGISFEIATEISNAKKIAVSEKVATEILEDIEGFASWMEQEMAYQLKAKLNTTLMTGTLSSTVPAGIQTISVPYSLTTVKTTNPNHWDSIRAAVAQLRSNNFKGAVTAFMNPIDYANMVLTKAQSQGQLFVPAESGATIVEDNNIPVGYVQVAILDLFKVLIYKDFMVTFGWENDDFTKNLVTAIGEMRIHSFHSENNNGAFIYDTFANIETALTTV